MVVVPVYSQGRALRAQPWALKKTTPPELFVGHCFLFRVDYARCRDYEPFHFVEPRNHCFRLFPDSWLVVNGRLD